MKMWLILAAVSALFLGIYEVFKKISVTGNAVLPVLLFSTITSGLIMLPVWGASRLGLISPGELLYVPAISAQQHVLLFVKAVIVLISWVFTYFALKHLPITIVSPVRSTAPLWTLLGAIVIFQEQLAAMQWAGILVTLLFFFLFSLSGKKEGVSIKSNKWMWFLIIGTLAGAVSGLYDKFLLRQVHRMAVQSYFSFYQVLIMVPVVLFIWWPSRQRTTPFVWRYTIPLIGLTLIVADFVYFYALSDPDSLISVVSALRRGSVVIAFLTGALLFKEKRIAEKAIYLIGIMAGIALLLFGSPH